MSPCILMVTLRFVVGFDQDSINHSDPIFAPKYFDHRIVDGDILVSLRNRTSPRWVFIFPGVALESRSPISSTLVVGMDFSCVRNHEKI
ncbi:hypothetical protein BD779DRAFT_1554993 [Infundibulicybe gibba]|nr:hypothetical protein BD779DRAFT_1554993 [Infundibulicybe gibba]